LIWQSVEAQLKEQLTAILMFGGSNPVAAWSGRNYKRKFNIRKICKAQAALLN
jgi:hypothetical protein